MYMKTIKTYLCTRWLCLMLSLMLAPLGATGMLAQSGGHTISHSVSAGETLYSLAKHYGVAVEDIYRLNPSAKDGLRVGQMLRIPARSAGQSSAGSSASSGSGTHIISAGETLYGVSRAYGVSEEDITRANPGISATYFPQGYPLRIPGSTRPIHSSPSLSMQSPEAEEDLAPAVNVCLILPISEGGRYVHFYEGFLMALNSLKKDGVSVNVSVHEASTEAEVSSLIRSGEIYDADIIIGGKDEEQVQLLASAKGHGLYVSPFITTYDSPSPHKPMLHINQPSMNVGLNAAEAFLRKYRGKTVYFVGRTSDKSDVFAQTLRQRLIEEGLPYRSVNIERETLTVEPSSVIVPISPDQGLAHQTLRAMQGLRSATLFGYPQWQSYGQSFLEELGKWNATIFSSFFFDISGEEEKQFILRYNAWYNKKVADSYPRYSVLGYDLGRYLIRSHAQYGHSFLSMADYLSSDGLQMDIRPVRSGQEGVWRNTSFYFITFSPDKVITKIPL